MADFCHGNGEDHCCYVDGQVCPFLEVDTMSGRHWVCGKRRELGSWQAVHDDPEYMEVVGSHFQAVGVDLCGDFMGARDDDNVTPQCCFADQFAVVYNTKGRGGVKNGEKNAEVGPGARTAGKSD